MKKIFINIFILFVLFSNIIFTQLNLLYAFQTWDIIFELMLVLIFIIKSIKSSLHIRKNDLKCFVLIFLLVLDGLMGNFIYNYASSYMAIFKDILSFLKFPLIFLLLKILNIDCYLSENLDKNFYNVLKFIVIVIFSCGIFSLFKDIGMSLNEYRHGIRTYTFLFSHPTYMVISMVFVLALFEYKGNEIKNKNFYELLIMAIIAMGMRTKGFAIIAVFIILKYFGNVLKKHKFISMFAAVLVVALVGYSKVALYMSFSSSAREILYRGSITLLTKCFPFGSGFGTFASHISGQYMSRVYDFINIKYVWEIAGNSIAQLGDTGFPYYVGQFGIIGIVLLVFLTKYIVKLTCINDKNRNATILILVYILIGLTSESTLANFGAELAIILAIVSSVNGENDKN